MNRTLTCVLISIVSAVLQMGCKNGTNKNTGHPSKDSTLVTTTNTDSSAHFDPNSEGVFVRYNEAKRLTTEWNAAIDGNQPQDFHHLYADTVNYYSKILTKGACIDNKTKWLTAHAGYQQKIEDLEVYYMDDDTAGLIFMARFTKICIDKNDTTKIQSYLNFKRATSGWRIVKETDQTTELNRAQKSPNSTLKPGENLFYYGYWTDTRDIPDFGHDEVPYWFSLTLNVGKKITGEYSLYSGTMRSITDYLVPEGKIENGILEITTVYIPESGMSLEDYNPDEVSDSRKEHWHFKIVNGNELVCLDKDNGYLYGQSLFLQK